MKLKTSFSVFLLVFSLLLSVSSCKKKPDDTALTQSIQTAVQTIPGVMVAVKDGVATLSGEVESDALISQAETAAKGVEGVKSVVNTLTVKPVPVVTAPEVERTFSADETLKAVVDDSFKKYNITGVTATVQDGEITLTGDVKRDQLQDIIKAANEAKPKKVNNKLNISK